MTLYDELIGLASEDLIEIFGETGSGKTSFATVVAKDAVAKGLKVAYIDSERNLIEKVAGVHYFYAPSMAGAYDIVMNRLAREFKLVVLDSLGMPILGEFAQLDAKGKGDALLKAIAIAYKLKQYSQQNKALVIIANQPESEFAKEKEHVLRPFGDKHQFYIKEVWASEMLRSDPSGTTCNIKSFRSRKFGRGRLLYSVNISGKPDDVKLAVERKW